MTASDFYLLKTYDQSRRGSSGGGVGEGVVHWVRTPALFRYNSTCALKFLDQFIIIIIIIIISIIIIIIIIIIINLFYVKIFT